MRDILVRELIWDDVFAEFGWIPVTQGEGYTMTYLANHSEIIDNGLRLVGIEVAIPAGRETLPNGTPKKILFADMIFARGNHFFVIETEDSISKKSVGKREAEERAEAFEELMNRNGNHNIDVTPVFVGIKYPKNSRHGYLVGIPVK
jgi:hypothetical protein